MTTSPARSASQAPRLKVKYSVSASGTVEAAAAAHEPHRIAFYLYDLAAAFHAHWNRGREEPGLRFVVEGEEELSRARLALVQAIGFVIGSGLKVFGVTPVEEMR